MKAALAEGQTHGLRLVYLAHPAGAPTREEHRANLDRARRWFAWAARKPGVSVIADWLLYCGLFDDFARAQRAMGLDACDAAIRRCDELWLVGGRVSEGMARGVATARAAGVAVVDLTHLGMEPPATTPSEDLRAAVAEASA